MYIKTGEGYGWSKGLTKETDERVKHNSETKKRLFAEGKLVSWFKNNKLSKESIEKARQKNLGKLTGDKNPAKRPEVRKKISEKKKKEKITIICYNCEKEFKVHPYRKRTAKFCSHFCVSKWQNKHNPKMGFQKGHEEFRTGESFEKLRLSIKRICKNPEYKEKMSKRGIKAHQKKQFGFQKGDTPWNKNVPWSEKIRKKQSKSHKGHHYSPVTEFKKGDEGIMGKNHWNWQNGISFGPYSFEWTELLREFIRKRDNHICQLCDKTQKEELKELGRKLTIHHINYDKKNCNPDNLITLCCSCNSKVNYKRKYWQQYFENKIKSYVPNLPKTKITYGEYIWR